VTSHYFSVLVFGIAQVAMDIEPLIRIIRGSQILHGWTHTYVGATLIGLPVMFFAPPLCRLILDKWNKYLGHRGLGWLRSGKEIGYLAAFTGAFIGTYSHVFFDSIMHWDMVPFWPWSTANLLLGLISAEALHIFCIACGLIGIFGWYWQGLRRRDKRENRLRGTK
jgi:hypothetical protein